MTADIVERLRSNEQLPVCPYDRLSPHYWTAPNDKPCSICGQENTSEGPDRCRGADTRVMKEAAEEIERLRGDVRAYEITFKRISEEDAHTGAPAQSVGMREALEAIVIRCKEGDKKFDWLETILDIAERALAAQPPAATAETDEEDDASYERGFRAGYEVATGQKGPLPQCSAATEDVKSKQAWQELVNKDDRTSPEEYPDHCLITFEELDDFMSRSRDISAGSVVPSLQGLVSDDDWNRALGCADSCLEAPSISLADFDNAMQHAFGMLSLRRLSLTEPQTVAVTEALQLGRQEINRQLERCRSDGDALPYETALAKIDAILALTRPHGGGK